MTKHRCKPARKYIKKAATVGGAMATVTPFAAKAATSTNAGPTNVTGRAGDTL